MYESFLKKKFSVGTNCFTYTHLHTPHTYPHTFTHMYIDIYMLAHVRAHARVCARTHTYTHMHRERKKQRNRKTHTHTENYMLKGELVQAQWFTPVILELKRLRQEDHHDDKVTLGYRVMLLSEKVLKKEKKVGDGRKYRQDSGGRPGCSRG